jgi:arylsulfatase
MVPPTPTGAFQGIDTYHWTFVDNIKRDPFEQNVGTYVKSFMNNGGALAAPSTAYLYDWNLLPIGQMLWLKELETYRKFPPLQAPASYNLDQIVHEMQEKRSISHAGD